jgi:SAM-dependent methyltransferase
MYSFLRKVIKKKDKQTIFQYLYILKNKNMLKATYKKLLSERIRNKIRTSLQRSIYPFYVGNKYYCNCCKKSFRKFLPKGNIKRKNAKCPYCFSLERVRLLDLYLTRETQIYKGKGLKILHFAPEEALYEKFITIEDIEYIDGDINSANARNTIDITNINFNNNYFDIIICSHILGHVPDEKKAIKEMYRVLKPNGYALVLTLLDQNAKKTFENPQITTPKEKLETYGEPDLCRLHGKDFGRRLSEAGFNVEAINYKDKLDGQTIKKGSFGNGNREIIFKCIK